MSVLAWTELPWQQVNDVWWPLARWRRAFFPPQVCERLLIDVLPGGAAVGSLPPPPP